MSKKIKNALTKTEKEWVIRLQKILSEAPTKRLGFFTIGDRSVSVYDRTFDESIDQYQEIHPNAEFCNAVSAVTGGVLATLDFPSSVHSTAG